MDETQNRLPLAVFLSGGGRTLENLLVHRDQHGLPIDVRLVLASRPGIRGIEIAEAAGIETRVIRKKRGDDAGYCEAMFGPVRQSGAKYVVMAGFLQHVLIPDDFERRVINIHPSLLPAFGGKGMYGHHVHEAAIRRGVTISGCTVHFVDNEYDHGPIILQQACEVLPTDTPDSLAARVFQRECEALPSALGTLR